MSLIESAQGWSAFALRYSLTILGAALVLCIVYQLAFVAYNLTFHPLAKFPGPKFSAVSHIPFASALVRGTHPYWVKELHDRYKSDVIRVSPTELSFISASALKDIYGHRSGRRGYDKDHAVYGKPPNGVDSVLTANHAQHSRMRRILDHAFSAKAFREQEPVVRAYVDKLIHCLREQIAGPTQGKVDVVNWYNWMSFDIIGDLSFGASFNCLEDQSYHPWVKMIFGNLKGIAFMGACNRFPIFRYLLPVLIPKRIKAMIADHFAYITDKITSRVKLGTNRPDLISPIIEHNTSEKGLTLEELRSNASLFVIAGSESIATNLSGATYYLLKNPDIFRRLKEEVRGSFKSDDEIDAQSVGKLPYLLAVLAETRRIYPTSLTGQAVLVPPEGDTICGQWIPGNTGITINHYAAFRSSTNFSLPDTFIPERWLDDPRFESDHKDVFQPFSYGPRNCIGKLLGDAETRLVLAKMVWNFDMEPCEESEKDWTEQKAFLSWQKTPLMVNLAPRSKG